MSGLENKAIHPIVHVNEPRDIWIWPYTKSLYYLVHALRLLLLLYSTHNPRQLQGALYKEYTRSKSTYNKQQGLFYISQCILIS